MREMKDSGISWIGDIPLEWDVFPLKYCFAFVAGATPDSTNADLWDGDVLWITPADYKTKDVYVFGGSRNLSKLGYKSCSTHMLPVGTVVVSKRAPIGTVAVTAKPLCTNQGCLGLVRKYNNISEKYYYYVLSIYDDVLNLYGTGTTFKEISATVFSNINVANPPYAQQKAIADFLDSKCSEIDALSADIQSEIDTLEAYKRSVITKAVTKGLDKNAPMKDSGIEWISKVPVHWETIPFKYVLNERNQKNNPPRTDERLSLSIGLGVTRYEDKTTNLDRFKEDVSQYKLAHVGDLVMNSMNMIVGATGVSNYFGCVSPAYYTFFDFEEDHVIAKFCEYMFLTPLLLGELHKLGKGIMFIERGEGKVNTCRLKVSRYDLGKIVLPIPPILEMRKIVEYLNGFVEDVDTMIKQKKEQLEILADYKKSVIYEYVTGKKEVLV